MPLERSAKIYVEGLDPALATARGLTVVSTVTEADVCVLRVVREQEGGERRGPRMPAGDAGGAEARAGRREGAAPRGTGVAAMATGGAPIDLTIAPEQLARLRTVMRAKPTVIAMYFDRPYVVPELARESAALLAHFGIADDALLDVLTGAHAPSGKLPFELPSSMEAVRAQKEDVLRDSRDPLYPYRHGITYPVGSARK